MVKQLFTCLCLLMPAVSAGQSSVTFSSPIQQTTLLELYTSEGCSSCPPADRWLSTLKDDPRLWKEIIPIAFHVDYWNYLGWKDPYSIPAYSQRQRNYARFNRLKTVYTPGFLQNGKEWRAWFRNRTINTTPGKITGQLVVTVNGDYIDASFTPVKPTTGPLQLNVAWMGFNLTTDVQSGENEGKQLQHDFVSLGIEKNTSLTNEGTHRWQFRSRGPIDKSLEKGGAAFWVTQPGNPTPIQATGGWIKNSKNK